MMARTSTVIAALVSLWLSAPLVARGQVRGPDPAPALNLSASPVNAQPATSGNQTVEPGVKEATTAPNWERSAWEFSLSPYLWMSSVRADVQAGPISTSTEPPGAR